MVSCRQCGSTNELSSKFCAQCGRAIAPEDVQAVTQETAKLVADGQRLFGEGRIADAYSVAESVLMKDPDNVPGLALKGDCLERQGDIAGALDCYEQVVTIKPDSPLDRIRVAQLRRIAALGPAPTSEKPDRRNTIFASVAGFVLLASAASALVLANKKDKPVAETLAYETQPSESRPFMTPAPVPYQEKDPTKQATDKTEKVTETVKPPTESPVESPNPSNSNPANRTTVHNVPDGRGVGVTAQLPDGFQPVSPNVDIVKEHSNTATATTDDPDPVPVKGEKDPVRSDANAHQAVIDIKPSVGSTTDSNPATNNGGTKPRTGTANEGTALIRVARQYFLAGEYDKAAKAYEKAIKAGVSAASANHRLAQCYVNLNRRAEALAAYQRALSAYQRMLDDGNGDKRLIESYMEECKQAIKLLQ